jgi:hypothetical protein
MLFDHTKGVANIQIILKILHGVLPSLLSLCSGAGLSGLSWTIRQLTDGGDPECPLTP